MKFSMMILALMTVSTSAFASEFCAPQAASAAMALANVNGSASDKVESATTRDGKVFAVVISENGVGLDTYKVTTSGQHDCIVTSVKVVGQPTSRP